MESSPLAKPQAFTALLALLIAVAALAPAGPVAAAERYVSDELHITFRRGPGSQYKIYRVLPTGTRVETLPPPEGADYSEQTLEQWAYVRADGQTGWVQERFLMDQRPARLRIGDVEQELAAARSEIEELESQLAAAESDKAGLQEELAAAEERIATLEGELEKAQRGYELVEANEELKERVSKLIERREALKERNRRLQSSDRRDWFLAGAGVLVGGLLLGLILPRLRPRRRGLGGDL